MKREKIQLTKPFSIIGFGLTYKRSDKEETGRRSPNEKFETFTRNTDTLRLSEVNKTTDLKIRTKTIVPEVEIVVIHIDDVLHLTIGNDLTDRSLLADGLTVTKNDPFTLLPVCNEGFSFSSSNELWDCADSIIFSMHIRRDGKTQHSQSGKLSELRYHINDLFDCVNEKFSTLNNVMIFTGTPQYLIGDYYCLRAGDIITYNLEINGEIVQFENSVIAIS